MRHCRCPCIATALVVPCATYSLLVVQFVSVWPLPALPPLLLYAAAYAYICFRLVADDLHALNAAFTVVAKRWTSAVRACLRHSAIGANPPVTREVMPYVSDAGL